MTVGDGDGEDGEGEGGEPGTGHILRELGFSPFRVDGEIHGSAPVYPEMWAPETTHLRTSILAAWTDHAAGLVAVDLLAPRIPVTLELDVHCYQPLPGDGTIHGVARAIKAGRSVVVLTVDFTDDGGEPVAVGTASFMAAPDPGMLMPPDAIRLGSLPAPVDRLRQPFAPRARCERREPGVAVLHRSEDGLNSSGTINGGLIALAIEEAALSLTPGATLCSMALRYLRPVRTGPAIATAQILAGLARVEVHDAPTPARQAVAATTRTFTP
jgi:acyl-coenzyme A thioesterase PaaI-like protein